MAEGKIDSEFSMGGSKMLMVFEILLGTRRERNFSNSTDEIDMKLEPSSPNEKERHFSRASTPGSSGLNSGRCS